MAENSTVVEVWEGDTTKILDFVIEGSGNLVFIGAKGGAGPYEVTQPSDDLIKVVLGPGLTAAKKSKK